MRIRRVLIIFGILTFGTFHGCATTPPPGNLRLIPLQEVNLELIFEENEGLEVIQENAKELRDFYRGGVQQKAKAEKALQEKNYPLAMKSYHSSNEFFSTLLEYIDRDSAEYHLFKETNILFFPNLLVADNNLKMGRIHEALERKRPAHRHWKRALSLVKCSLKSERTEWGLALQKELLLLLAPKKD